PPDDVRGAAHLVEFRALPEHHLAAIEDPAGIQIPAIRAWIVSTQFGQPAADEVVVVHDHDETFAGRGHQAGQYAAALIGAHAVIETLRVLRFGWQFWQRQVDPDHSRFRWQRRQ